MRNEIIIHKMLGYIDKILRYCDNTTYDDFENNSLLLEACVFNLSQIGELCSKVDSEYISAHPDIPWKQMRGLRNKIVHDYEGVNLNLVWEIISNDLLELERQLKELVLF